MFYLVTEDGVVTSKLSGSYIPCFSVYEKSLSEITQHSEDLYLFFIPLTVADSSFSMIVLEYLSIVNYNKHWHRKVYVIYHTKD